MINLEKGKVYRRSYYYVEHNGSTLDVKKGLNIGFMPLIWNNAGLYGIISREKVENMVQLIADQKKLPVVERVNRMGVFYWEECVVLDAKIVKLLIGEKR